DDDLEIVMLVTAIRLDAAEVPFRVAQVAVKRTAEHRPRAAIIERHRLGQVADLRRPLDEDVVPRQERVGFLDAWLEVVEELLAAVDPAIRKIIMHAADGDVAVSQAGATDLLEQIEDHLALPERVQEGAECPQVEAVRSHRDQVAGNAVELG